MKKQIITIVSVALTAILLFVSYVVFFKDSGIETVGDPFYTLTDSVKSELESVESDVTLALVGRNESDEGWEMITLFAEAVVDTNGDFELTEESGSFSGVRVSVGSSSKEIAFSDFFKTRYDGTRYAFDGESLIANAILSLAGREELNISLRALDGFDTDGDRVTENGNPYMFDKIDNRSRIAYLTVKNSHGEYSVYNDEGDFYFASSRAISYDEEMFSMLNSNCRLPVTYGKMTLPEGKSYDTYGLNEKEPTTGSYTIMTQTASDGTYELHTVYLGNLSSSGSYYFARYIGGVFTPSEGEGGDELVRNTSKDFIYYFPASVVEGTLMLPQTDFMKPTIVNAITETNQLFAIDNFRVDDFASGVSLVANRLLDFNAADNLSAIDTSSLTKVICDKVTVSDLSKYSDGWYNHIDVFGGFSSSDGKRTYVSGALAKKSAGGDYKVEFGLLRDEANGAYLPSNVIVEKSYDGYNWIEVEGGDIVPRQDDKSMGRYTVEFKDEATVKYVRVEFDIPLLKNTYVVFDEIRITSDGEDLQPSSAIGGQWKLISPENLFPEDRNYGFLDMINFNDFVQSIAALEGERVVGCAFSEDGDATRLKKDVLEKFGLAEPDKHYSFEYDDVVTELYVSKPTADGKYYAYTTFTGIVNDKEVCVTTDVIVELTTATAKWLAWDTTEYLDHSLLSFYLVDIDRIILTADGVASDFDVVVDSSGALSKVLLGDREMDVTSFKYLYQAIISIYMQDEYVPSEGDTPEEYFRIKVYSDSTSPEIVFYRVSATKCYFTIDGQGSYYCLVADVNEALDRLESYLAGGILNS